MMPAGRSWLRGCLALLALILAVAGGWQYFAPRSFYTDIPTVSADPPFNLHLMTDVGGLGLALAVVLGAAALYAEPVLVRVALVAYLVYAVSHLVFHATHLAGMSAAGAAFLLTSLSVEPVAGVALLVLAVRVSPRPPAPPGRDSTPADPGSQARSW